MRKVLLAILIVPLLFRCTHRNTGGNLTMAPTPVFNADSAFHYIQQQVQLGPRIPNSQAHRTCGDLLVTTLLRARATVTEQKDSVVAHTGVKMPMRNIIASFYPESKKRILLFSNWDTRSWADRSDTLVTTPASGANGGASGVGILLEIARLIGSDTLAVGVDIILFDMEDQDRPAYDTQPGSNAHFGNLGTRYWAAHRNGYTASYAIQLNMVGAKDAKFTLEGNSMKYAEPVLKRVWDTGNKLGYGAYFHYNRTPFIQDAHAYMNELTGIPAIDIIHYDPNGTSPFWEYWHTHGDTMHTIDKGTLTAVGQTLLQVIYNDTRE